MAQDETAIKHKPQCIPASGGDCIQDPGIGILKCYLYTNWPPLKGKKGRDWKDVKKKVITGRKKAEKKETGTNTGRSKFEGPSDWQSSMLPLDLPASL